MALAQLPFVPKPATLREADLHMKSLSFSKRFWILAVTGALGGTLGDFCHVLSHTDGYPLSAGPQIPGMGIPFWVPPLFAAAGLGIGFSHPWADRQTGAAYAPRPGVRSATQLTWALALFLGTWALSGFWTVPAGGIKDLVLGTLAVASWIAFDRTWTGLGLALVTSALGTGAEIFQIRALGTFYYTEGNRNLFGAPSWLPFIYCCGSVAVGNLGRVLARGFIRAS
jgi:hypothetical protein